MVTHRGPHIFVNNRKLTLKPAELSGRELLITAGFSEPEEWDLYRLRGENDTTGGILVACDDTVSVKDGDRFRVVKGNRTCSP